jgi:hypothetical protein
MTKCTIDDCTNTALAKGLCNAHYLRQRRGKDMSLPVQIINPTKTCIECGKDTNKKGGYLRCALHYKVYKRKKIKDQLIQKLGGKCVKCNGIFPNAAFDFHHLGNKEMDISTMIDRFSEEKINQEVEKCVLLCANCHRIHHAEQL